jgi:hypothetical protein
LSKAKPVSLDERPSAIVAPSTRIGSRALSDRHDEARRRRPGERRAQPRERLAVHVLVEEGEAVEVVRAVVVAVARDGVDAGVELARQPISSSARDGSATRQRSPCASRAESKVASGPAIAAGRAAAAKPSAPSRCGPRRIQNSANQARWPSSHATRFTPACIGTRQASSSRSIVSASVVARESRSASAERGAGEAAGIDRHRRRDRRCAHGGAGVRGRERPGSRVSGHRFGSPGAHLRACVP